MIDITGCLAITTTSFIARRVLQGVRAIIDHSLYVLDVFDEEFSVRLRRETP